MLEDSVEGFIARWRAHATDGVAFARAEGSPLLEVAVDDAVLQLFERTGPYDAPTGQVRLILHAVATRWSTADGGVPGLAAVGPASLRVAGSVVEREPPFVVVDAGVPVVLALEPEDEPRAVPEIGAWIACETLAPAHGFVIRHGLARKPTVPTDDLV